MSKNLSKIEDFFKYNLEIKKRLSNMAPNGEDNYNVESRIRYVESLLNNLDMTEYYFVRMITSLGFGQDVFNMVHKMFVDCKIKIQECGFDFKKLSEFYDKNISFINPELVTKINQKCVGYSLNNGLSLITQVKTLNELLHLFHSFVTNNEYYYISIKELATKNNDEGYPIRLRGKDSASALNIFESFPADLSCGWTDIISLPDSNKILIMVRDRGHALSIEISIEKDKCFVSYFIPKICNAPMVNNLKGVTKVTNASPFTVGMFETSLNNLPNEVISLIKGVPMDNDMFVEGGPFFEENNSKVM